MATSPKKQEKNPVEHPHTGMSSWTNQHGITILRLHYSADEDKGSGTTTYVPEINKHLSPWALAAYGRMTDPTLYLKEYEIDAESALGALLFNFDEKLSVEPVREIPPDWTRRMAVDPHPAVPHAFLWCATDPWGDRHYYRELWPSKVCYEWRSGLLHGKDGPCPQDEKGPSIRDYVQTVKYLESGENPENRFRGEVFEEDVFARVIDYAARAFGKGTSDDPEQENYQQRYEKAMLEFDVSRPFFDDAKKDRQSGLECVNEGFKRIERMGNNGEYQPGSRIHILGERCPELIHQLKTVRRQLLTPLQVQRQDPTGKPVKVRNHMTDCIAAGTLITTDHGDIPIERVQIGMKALTRSGWKRVTDSWLVNPNAKVIEVAFAGGGRLCGTPNHRILTGDGKWKTLESLTSGEMCVLRPLNSMGVSTDDIPIPNVGVTDATLNLGNVIYTVTSGLRRMARSLMGIISTIAMVIGRTTVFQISLANQEDSTSATTDDVAINPFIERLSTGSDRWLHFGMEALREGAGIASTQKKFGRRLRFVHWCVQCAGDLFRPRKCTVLDSAAPTVEQLQVVRVVDCWAAGTAPVYDLTIEDAHEFYANGILVHNCLRYLEMANPIYIARELPSQRDNFQPMARGFSY